MIDRLFAESNGHGGKGADFFSDGQTLLIQILQRNCPVDESDPFGFLSVDDFPRKHEFFRQTGPDEPRQFLGRSPSGYKPQQDFGLAKLESKPVRAAEPVAVGQVTPAETAMARNVWLIK